MKTKDKKSWRVAGDGDLINRFNHHFVLIVSIVILCWLQSAFCVDWTDHPLNIAPGNTDSIIDMWADVNTNFQLIVEGGGTGAIPDKVSSVTSTHIADGTIQQADMAANSIGTGQIQDNAITAADLAPDSVGPSEVAANAINSDEIEDESLTADDLAPDSVGSSELADNSVDTDAIQDNAVTGGKIVNGTITAADLAINSVGTDAISDSGIMTQDIADGMITSQKLASTTWQAINDNTLSQTEGDNRYLQEVANGSVTSQKLASTTWQAINDNGTKYVPMTFTQKARFNDGIIVTGAIKFNTSGGTDTELTKDRLFIGQNVDYTELRNNYLLFKDFHLGSTKIEHQYGGDPVAGTDWSRLNIDNDLRVQGNFTVDTGFSAALPADSTKAGVQIATMDDIQSPYDCVIPDDYSDLATALAANQTSIYVRGGSYVSELNSALNVNHDILLQGIGQDKSEIILKQNFGLNDISRDGVINLVKGNSFIAKNIKIKFVNNGGDKGFGFNIKYVPQNETYNLLLEDCQLQSEIQNGSEVRWFFMNCYCTGTVNVTIKNCYINDNSSDLNAALYYTEGSGYGNNINPNSKFIFSGSTFKTRGRQSFAILALWTFNLYLYNNVFDISGYGKYDGNSRGIYSVYSQNMIINGNTFNLRINPLYKYSLKLLMARSGYNQIVNNTIIDKSERYNTTSWNGMKGTIYVYTQGTNTIISGNIIYSDYPIAGNFPIVDEPQKIIQNNILYSSVGIPVTNYGSYNDFVIINNTTNGVFCNELTITP